MKELYEKVKACNKCPNLIKCWQNGMEPAILLNNYDAEILFVGVNPAMKASGEEGKSYEEVIFNNNYGKLFIKKFCEKSGIPLSKIYWSNISKCSSPENRELLDKEMDNCFPILQEQINKLNNLKIIIILGKQAANYLNFNKLIVSDKIKIINFFHPAYILRGNFHLIDELVNKVLGKKEDTKEIEQIQTKWNDIYEFYRDENKIKRCNKIEFNNYFYVKDEDLDIVLDLIKNNIDRNLKYMYTPPSIEIGFKNIYNEKVTKIIPNKFEWWKIKKLLREKKIQTYEYNLDVYLKYLISNKRSFSKDRKIGIIDIENYLSLDVDNTPAPITAITLYKYDDDKYFTWCFHDKLMPEKQIENNKILYFFKDEKSMLLDFVEKFREYDLSMCLGWNVEKFDFAYIINRLIKLKINPNQLSNWCEYTTINVESRKVIYNRGKNVFYHITIPGIEIIDMILPMKKCNCYSEMPASFSLVSTCNWYLKDEKKLIDIGASAWKMNLNLFINYNIHDVYLVKKLIDEYKLIDFMYVIQTEVANVPLIHCTHNSIVLLYYLKQTFPAIIIPDNTGFFEIDGEKIDLAEFYLKLKAAIVMKAPTGVFNDMLIFDFAALYTTLFRTFNICPSTINLKDGVEIDDIVIWKIKEDTVLKEYKLKRKYLQNPVGIYPQLLKGLWEKRNFYKSKMKEFKDKKDTSSIAYKTWLYRSDVAKQILNSLFGVGGYINFNIYNPIISASVTAMGRELIKYAGEYCKSRGLILCGMDTDSLFLQNVPNLNEYEFEKELNEKLKEHVFTNYPQLNKDNYCLFIEFQRKLKAMVFKGVKKKYFGVDYDGKLLTKGFSIVRHDTPLRMKIHLEKLFLMLINKVEIFKIREYLKEIKKEIKTLAPKEIGLELKLSQNPNEYESNQEISRGSMYSNRYLNTNFAASDVGKLLYIKKVNNLPQTDVIFIDESTILDSRFEIDYDKMFKKLILDSLNLLIDIKEFRIEEIITKNKLLTEYVK